MPTQPIEEVHAGKARPAEEVVNESPVAILEAPAEPLSPRQTKARSAAGHGVAMKGAVTVAEYRKSLLTTILVVAAVAVVVGVGGLVAYLVLR